MPRKAIDTHGALVIKTPVVAPVSKVGDGGRRDGGTGAEKGSGGEGGGGGGEAGSTVSSDAGCQASDGGTVPELGTGREGGGGSEAGRTVSSDAGCTQAIDTHGALVINTPVVAPVSKVGEIGRAHV